MFETEEYPFPTEIAKRIVPEKIRGIASMQPGDLIPFIAPDGKIKGLIDLAYGSIAGISYLQVKEKVFSKNLVVKNLAKIKNIVSDKVTATEIKTGRLDCMMVHRDLKYGKKNSSKIEFDFRDIARPDRGFVGILNFSTLVDHAAVVENPNGSDINRYTKGENLMMKVESSAKYLNRDEHSEPESMEDEIYGMWHQMIPGKVLRLEERDRVKVVDVLLSGSMTCYYMPGTCSVNLDIGDFKGRKGDFEGYCVSLTLFVMENGKG